MSRHAVVFFPLNEVKNAFVQEYDLSTLLRVTISTRFTCVISKRVLREGLFTSTPLPTNSRGCDILNSLPAVVQKASFFREAAGRTSPECVQTFAWSARAVLRPERVVLSPLESKAQPSSMCAGTYTTEPTLPAKAALAHLASWPISCLQVCSCAPPASCVVIA